MILISPPPKIGLFAKIRPGGFFFVHPVEKLSTFYFLANHMKDHSFYAIKHSTIRAVIGMATPIHH